MRGRLVVWFIVTLGLFGAGSIGCSFGTDEGAADADITQTEALYVRIDSPVANSLVSAPPLKVGGVGTAEKDISVELYRIDEEQQQGATLLGHKLSKTTAVDSSGLGSWVVTFNPADLLPEMAFVPGSDYRVSVTMWDGPYPTGDTLVQFHEIYHNLAPQAVSDEIVLDALSSLVFQPLLNDSDADRQPLTLTLLTQPVSGIVEARPSGVVVYVPYAGMDFNGVDSFEYEISDGLATSRALFSFRVFPKADAVLIARDDVISTNGRKDLRLNIFSNDAYPGEHPRVVSYTQPKHGFVTVAEGRFIYLGDEDGFEGKDFFDYTLMQGQARSTARVTIVHGSQVLLTLILNAGPSASAGPSATGTDYGM